jgi:Transposase zinc-binding domain
MTPLRKRTLEDMQLSGLTPKTQQAYIRALHPSHAEGRTTRCRGARATHSQHAMLTLGDLFRRYGPQYRARYGHQMSSEQHAAMHAIELCRTEALGGHIYSCEACR